MKTVSDPAVRAELVARVRNLSSESLRHWGRMTPQQMLCHISDALRILSGEIPTKRVHGRLRHPVFRWLFIYVLPIPRGRIRTTKDFQTTSPGVWAEDVMTFAMLVDRIPLSLAAPVLPTHPAFGPLSRAEWGALTYKHLDHHLRQFSV